VYQTVLYLSFSWHDWCFIALRLVDVSLTEFGVATALQEGLLQDRWRHQVCRLFFIFLLAVFIVVVE
jgi:hypothetical protein